MTFKTLLRSVGASALVGAMALAALPTAAHAQDDRPNREARWKLNGAERQAARQQRAQQAPQQNAQAAPQQRQYTQPAQAPQRSGRDWNRGDNRNEVATQRAGRDWNRRDNSSNDWGQARAAQAQAQAEARKQARAQAEAAQRAQRASADSNRSWGGLRNPEQSTSSRGNWQRNGSYANRDRNGSYRDGYRDGRTVDQRQDRYDQRSAYRNGYRDGNVTQHYRDGSRYDRRRYDGNHQRWSNNWRYDNRYNWQSYRNYNRNVFRLGSYYSPYRNYRYSRLSVGFHLDSLFFGSRYWINDPWQYRLPPAYGPYRWIRYYDDALLVDTYTGEVVDVEYSFFW